MHARIEEIDQCVVEYCRVDIVQQSEGLAAPQLLESCMYSARSSKTDMAVDELTLKVTAKLHEPRSKTKQLVSWTPLDDLSTTPAR